MKDKLAYPSLNNIKAATGDFWHACACPPCRRGDFYLNAYGMETSSNRQVNLQGHCLMEEIREGKVIGQPRGPGFPFFCQASKNLPAGGKRIRLF